MTTDTLHRTSVTAVSIATWDIPAAIAAGEHFCVKVGAKSEAGCALGGCGIEVLDEAGAVVARGTLGATPWPGTDALFWSEVELCAPSAPGTVPRTVRLAGEGPHGEASAAFSIAVVAAPQHVVTVTVAALDGPVAGAIVRAGPIRAMTDAAGRARLHLAKGPHQLAVWKAGYDTEPVPLSVEADAAVTVEARALPEDDPDAVWTA